MIIRSVNSSSNQMKTRQSLTRSRPTRTSTIALTLFIDGLVSCPALEELYNNGPQPGSFVYGIGNQNLTAEQGDVVDFSLRHASRRARLETSAFYYNLHNIVFTVFTGQTDARSDLPIVNYDQGTS